MFLLENVEKVHQRRSRHFVVLTYSNVRSARQHKGVPLRDKLNNFALRDAASYGRPF
jgi:hypothetical protein